MKQFERGFCLFVKAKTYEKKKQLLNLFINKPKLLKFILIKNFI